MATSKKNQPAKTTKKDVAVVDFAGVANDAGFEEASMDAFAVPFLRVLQSGSPQVSEDEESYIKGAKPSFFFNTISRVLYGKEVQVIPIYYQRDFVEWKPSRGGFVRSHGSNPNILDNTTRDEDDRLDTLPNGNIIQDTRNHYVLIADDLLAGPVILSLTSTGIRHSRNWMSQMKALMLPGDAQKRAPMLSSVYTLATVKNENDEGKWYQIGDKSMTAITRENWVNKMQFEAAKLAHEMIVSGKTRAAYESTDDGSTSDDGMEPF